MQSLQANFFSLIFLIKYKIFIKKKDKCEKIVTSPPRRMVHFCSIPKLKMENVHMLVNITTKMNNKLCQNLPSRKINHKLPYKTIINM